MGDLKIEHRTAQPTPSLPILIQDINGAIDGDTSGYFERGLKQVEESGYKNVIFSFVGVTEINSTGMGALIQCADAIRELGGEICLVGVTQSVLSLFEMLGLLPILPVHGTEEDAIEHLVRHAGAPQGTTAATAPPAGATPAEPAAPAEATAASPSDSGAAQAAEPGVEPGLFPLELTCPDCQKDLELGNPGYFRCPVCGCYFIAEASGNVQAVRLDDSKLAELRLPRDPAMAEGLKKVAASLVSGFGYPAEVVSGIDRCLEQAWHWATHGADGAGDRIQLYLVANTDEWVAGLTLPGSVGEGAPVVDGLRPLADQVELAPIPTGGHVLRFSIKVSSQGVVS